MIIKPKYEIDCLTKTANIVYESIFIGVAWTISNEMVDIIFPTEKNIKNNILKDRSSNIKTNKINSNIYIQRNISKEILKALLMNVGSVTLFCGSLGTASCLMETLRNKKDSWNAAFGGAVAGSIVPIKYGRYYSILTCGAMVGLIDHFSQEK